MTITFSLRTTDGSFACAVNHGVCMVPEHLLIEDEYAIPGHCFECSYVGQDTCSMCSLELNVSNSNAALLLTRLDLPFQSWGDIEGVELLGRAMTANVGQDDSGTTPTADRLPGGSTRVDCGLRAGYYDERLESLARLAQAAIEFGFLVTWS